MIIGRENSIFQGYISNSDNQILKKKPDKFVAGITNIVVNIPSFVTYCGTWYEVYVYAYINITNLNIVKS